MILVVGLLSLELMMLVKLSWLHLLMIIVITILERYRLILTGSHKITRIALILRLIETGLRKVITSELLLVLMSFLLCKTPAIHLKTLHHVLRYVQRQIIALTNLILFSLKMGI